jgi:hypothetical protein
MRLQTICVSSGTYRYSYTPAIPTMWGGYESIVNEE